MLTAVRTAHVICLTCAVLFLAAACSGAGDTVPPGVPSISFRADPRAADYGAVDVAPLESRFLSDLRRRPPTSDEWRTIFAVWVGDSAGLPMFGEYTISDSAIRFTPRYPPSPGNRYIARFDSARFNRVRGRTRLHAGSTARWSISADSSPGPTVVEVVYPSADSVPMNLLRMYVRFSAPMSVGQVAQRLHIVDDSGQAVEDAFLVPAGAEELWDPSKQRLTLLFDPGRIKRDLRPHEERGLPLREGRRYSIVIDAAWRDAAGHVLARPFRKDLRVGPSDRTLPRTANWRVTVPGAGTRGALMLTFPEPLDRALLERMLVVHAADGQVIAGAVGIGAHEREWSFTPAAAWTGGAHYVEIDTELEDLAGNNLKRLFDVMPGDSASRGVNDARVRVAFTPLRREDR